MPQKSLPNAVGLNSASFNTARLIGPALAGFMVAGIGSGWVFIINGMTFVATIIALLFMRVGELTPFRRAPRSPGQIREGFRYVRGRPELVVVMVVVSSVAMMGLNFQLTSAMMARIEFGRGAEDYGIIGSILAIGSLAGALLAARRSKIRLRLILGAAMLFGVSSAVMAPCPRTRCTWCHVWRSGSRR